MTSKIPFFRIVALALCLLVAVSLARAQHGELLKQGQWTVQSPAACSSLPELPVRGPGTLFHPENAGALADLQHALSSPLTKQCPGTREAILVNGRGRRLIKIEGAAALVTAATPLPVSPRLDAPLPAATGTAARPPVQTPLPTETGTTALPPAQLQGQKGPQPLRPVSASASNTGASGTESPFVDVVQFRNQPARHPIASEHHDEPGQIGPIRLGTPQIRAGVAPNRMDYKLVQFVSIIDRALSNENIRFALERSTSGKWIPATVRFTSQDQTFSTAGFPYLGRIIASKPSEFTVTLAENGIVSGRQTGSTDDLRGSGMGSPPTGTMSWTGTETLDLNTGLDSWTFKGQMEGRYSGHLLGGVKGTLTASDSVHSDFVIIAGLDESRTKGDVNVASDPTSSRALLIGDLKFRSSTGAPALRFSDRGVLTVTLVNRAGLDLNEAHYAITTAEKIDGILNPGKLSGAFRIARDSQTNLSPVIGTGFGIPVGGVNFVVTISYRNTILARKTLSVPTDPFYRDNHVRLPDATAPRLRAVAKYFGTGGVPYGDPAPELAASASRDPLAAMWEAAFHSQGVAGYALDREKAYEITRRVLPRLEESARSGDAEGLYLFFYACQLGLEGENAQADAGQFLDLAASAGFLPAKFDRARQLTFSKADANALATLKEVYDSGIKRAAFVLGKIYEQGHGVERDPQTALKWYRLGAEFGDPAALLGLANLTATGVGDSQPDMAKAMQLARQAATRKYAEAYLFIGRAYESGRQGVKQDTAVAVEAFKSAADLGDPDAMVELGEAFLGNVPGFISDERAGIYWIRHAAERESPKAMLMLSNCYREGKVIGENLIAARYWFNQAAVHGAVPGDRRGLEAQRQVFLDFWRSADFSPSYIVVDRYGHKVRDGDDGMLNGIFSGMLGAMTSYYGNQQALIDGLEFIQKRNGKKIYGGTVSSAFTSKLQLRAGQTVSIRVYGVISTGMFSGAANADGLGEAWPEYRLFPNISTSAVVGKIGDSPWQLVGTRAQIAASNNGLLAFGLNALDYSNYKGYFDVVVEVADEE